jgi:hypothetical protein
MPLIEDGSRPSSMAVVSRCATVPIAAVRPLAIPPRSGRRVIGLTPEKVASTRNGSRRAVAAPGTRDRCAAPGLTSAITANGQLSEDWPSSVQIQLRVALYARPYKTGRHSAPPANPYSIPYSA